MPMRAVAGLAGLVETGDEPGLRAALVPSVRCGRRCTHDGTDHPSTTCLAWPCPCAGRQVDLTSGLLLGALAQGDSHVSGFLASGDCQATVHCLRALGIAVDEIDATTLTVHGRGLHGLHPPSAPLDCRRSGTTMRLLAGLMAGQAFASVLTGDTQLRRRPMERVAAPLRQMGGHVDTTDGHAPLTVRGGHLHGIDFSMPIASAQVKSALLLAGLYADGPTILREPGPARDHTERMLRAMIVPRPTLGGAGEPLTRGQGAWTLDPAQIDHLRPLDIVVPAISPLRRSSWSRGHSFPDPRSRSAAWDQSTRTGLLDVLRDMGARIDVRNEGQQGGEPVADLVVRPERFVALGWGAIAWCA